MDVARGVGQHLEAVELRPLRVLRDLEGPGLGPGLLPARLDVLEVVVAHEERQFTMRADTASPCSPPVAVYLTTGQCPRVGGPVGLEQPVESGTRSGVRGGEGASEHPAHDRGRGLGDAVEVVAALEDRHEAPAAAPEATARHTSISSAKPAGAEGHAPERVVPVGVEAGRDENELRVEGPADRLHDLPVGAAVLAVTQAGRHREVDGEAAAFPLPHLVEGARAGVVRELVRRDEEDPRVPPERLLRAVAVVDVEVDDGDPLQAAGEGRGGAHGHVVEEAEAHGPARGRVVPRGAHRAEGPVERRRRARLLDRVHDGARRPRRRVPRPRAHGGVRVEANETFRRRRPRGRRGWRCERGRAPRALRAVAGEARGPRRGLLREAPA